MILKEESITRNHWPLAIIEEVFASSDHHVRKVELRLADHNLNNRGVRTNVQSVLERPIHKLVLLVKAPVETGEVQAKEP